MIYPTRRAVLLVAGAAPVALVVAVLWPGAWFAVALWAAAMAALCVGDGLLAPAAPVLDIDIPGAMPVGGEAALHLSVDRAGAGLEIAIAAGPRLALPLGDRLAIDRSRRAILPVRALRRGRERFDRAWLRWPGPLGLAWRQAVVPLDRDLVITPDLRPVHDQGPVLLRQAELGERVQALRGGGSEFEALTEWRAGMDRRHIDWKQSARHHLLLAKEMRDERNNQIVLAVDAGRAMSDPVAGVPRVDRAVSAALLAGFVALRLGDKVALAGFDARPRVATGLVSGARSFARLQRAAADLDYSAQETNHTLALGTIAGALTRRALVVVFTEVTDLTGAELMLRAAAAMLQQHLVLFVFFDDPELEGLAGAYPEDADTIAQAVTAAALLRERRLVAARLRAMGLHVLEAPHDQVGPALVRTYLEFKRKNLL